MPYPAASVSLLDGLGRATGIEPAYGELREEAAATRERLDALVAENPQHQAMVTQLEELADSDDDTELETLLDGGELPTGDELAAELQEFLRHQDDD
jgi:ribosome assembly protein YihI (activator of Der GTPase)